MNMYLDSVELTPGSNNYTYAYQWATWDSDTMERTASIVLLSMRLELTFSYPGLLETLFYSLYSRARTFKWH